MASFKTKLLTKNKWQKRLVRFGSVPHPRKWVFIVGCYNSGTTLLADLMAAHGDISALPVEGVQLSDVWPLPETYAWNRMWFKCLNEMTIDPDGPGSKSIAERVKKQWSLSFEKRPLLLEKSIANVPRMLFLQKHFAPAYFIYIVRNGYAVSEGLRRGAKPLKYGCEEFGEQYPISLCAEQWAYTDTYIEGVRDQLEHLHEFTYEEFTADPALVMGAVTDFLDIAPFNPAALARIWRIHGVRSEIRDMNAEAIACLSVKDLEEVRQSASTTLEKYSYAPS
jgi:hypothetical protein